jgi:hypothetical protein
MNPVDITQRFALDKVFACPVGAPPVYGRPFLLLESHKSKKRRSSGSLSLSVMFYFIAILSSWEKNSSQTARRLLYSFVNPLILYPMPPGTRRIIRYGEKRGVVLDI